MGRFLDLKGTLETIYKVGRASLDASGLTAARTHTLPDTSGTLALTSQLSGGGGSSGTATLNFGAYPGGMDASTVITGQTGIAAGSKVNAWVVATATADHSDDEHRVEQLHITAGNIVAGTGFTIYGDATGNLRLYGLWTVAWNWS